MAANTQSIARMSAEYRSVSVWWQASAGWDNGLARNVYQTIIQTYVQTSSLTHICLNWE